MGECVETMAYNAKKTTHAGAKHGRGAYYGRKADAKKESSRIGRRQAKKAIKPEGEY